MSQIARELKMLFYLDRKYNTNKYIKISELSEYLEISARQVRRYRDDIEQAGFSIDAKYGSDGGYKLLEPLDKNLMIPDNIMLALSLASKNNDSLLKSLSKLPVTSSINKNVGGDNFISDHAISVMSAISDAINLNKTIEFQYEMYNKRYAIVCEPYKLMYSNHSYYLRGVSKYGNELRRYDVEKIHNVVISNGFTKDEKIITKIDEELQTYGLMDDAKTIIVRLKYFDYMEEAMIDRHFEYKGKIDHENMTYTVLAKDNRELFIPIFALGDMVEIIDNDIKRKYKKYLEKVIRKL